MQSESDYESKEEVARVGLTVHPLPDNFVDRFKQLKDLTGKVINNDIHSIRSLNIML